MLLDSSIYNGKSAAEFLEETKKYYVKTRELKENKIDLSTPRLYKSPSEEEMEQIVSELRKRPSIKHPIPSTELRITQSFCSPTTFGTSFCITGSTEQPQRMQSFCTSATSAFNPVIRTPPRPPKSEKVREKLKLQTRPDTASTSSILEILPPRPIPPPRRSLLQKSESRPIPPPRQRITMTTSYHSPSNFTPFELTPLPEKSPSDLSNALSTPNLMNNSICCSTFESLPVFNSRKNVDLMSSSWYGPITATNVQPIRLVPNRLRIPVKPNQLTVTVLGPKNTNTRIVESKLIKPIPIRSSPESFKVTRSHSSITPSISRLSNYHSPGTTSGAGTASGTSMSNQSVGDFHVSTLPNKHIISSPTASKDSGAHDCSNVGSEIEESPEIKQVDKDFEERIKRWDSFAGTHQRISPAITTSTPAKPPPIAPKPVFSADTGLKVVDKFFDRCGLPSTTDSASDIKLHDVEDVQEISSIDSNFTSITDNNIAQLETSEKDQNKDQNEIDETTGEPKPKTNVASKPVSTIEKNARVIQWIHGCTIASTVC